MFDTLSDRLSDIFSKLTKRGYLSEENVDEALKEVRRALIEADVALIVVKDFLDKVRQRAVGQEVLKSVSPAQLVIKIVNDTLTDLLGSDDSSLNLKVSAPSVIMMVGLQGSGKTTTSAKIAKFIRDKYKLKILMASLDVKRPAAQEQLEILGRQIGIDTLPIIKDQTPVSIAKRAIGAAKVGGYDSVILDTAGRLHVDSELMNEMEIINSNVTAHEILLVADSLTGQDAVNVANSFSQKLPLTGVILTRLDGDSRGGAALSMKAITGKPIKFIGVGEKIDDIEEFYPSRLAGRILGMGDIVSLVEKAKETIDTEKAEKIASKIAKGIFDLDDMSSQLQQMSKMGGISGLLGMLPGIGKIKKQMAEANLDDSVVKRQIAIISSMTKKERRSPKILNASRKKRIAKGSGSGVPEVNKLVKLHRQTSDMMKKFGKRGMLNDNFGVGMSEDNANSLDKPLNLTDNMLAEIGKSTTKGLPGLPGLSDNKNKLSGLLNLTGRKK